VGKRATTNDARMRQLMAQEAARIMAEEGIGDYLIAKRKAAERLAAPDTRNLPTNKEIQEALIDYQRLFQADDQASSLLSLRRTAVEAMRFLERFRPRLVGAVLHGTATQHSDVDLHIFASSPEDVALYLIEHQIPYEASERKLRFGREEHQAFPVFRFVAGDVVVDLTVFSDKGLREAPRSRIDGQPMERASLAAVEAMLRESVE